MKKYILLMGFFILFFKTERAQNATSLGDGNWNNPSTWTCNCVPSAGYQITINHVVTLNNNFSYSSGSITINTSGSLSDENSGKTLNVTGGSLTNNGIINLHKLITQTGSFYNDGIITASSYINSINFFNNGTFSDIDSIYNYALITNNGSFLNIGKTINKGIFTNNGDALFLLLNNDGVFNNNKYTETKNLNNTATFTNRDSVIVSENIYNRGMLVNEVNGNIVIEKMLSNKSLTNNKACINNNGYIHATENISNYDTLKGITGIYEVRDSSRNDGTMNQRFTFCDQSPPSSPPYIDNNEGTISSEINWCIATLLNHSEKKEISIYPNPSIDRIYINNPPLNEFTVIICDSHGTCINRYQNKSEIDISNYENGIYFITIQRSEHIYQSTLVVIK